MEKSELKKQFQATLYEWCIMITTPSNNYDAYEAKLNLPPGRKIKIGSYNWIETGFESLNYHECCGVLILFGVTPPSLDELYNLLNKPS